MENGGKREGAGRKAGSANKQTQAVRDLMDKCVDFEGLVNKLVELVDGVEVEERINKETITYTLKPDAYAAKILLEYRYGKPAQTIDLNTKVELLKPQINISKEGEKISLEIKPILEILPADELPT